MEDTMEQWHLWFRYSRDHHVTVIQTSPACHKKVAPIRERTSFAVIEEDIIYGDKVFTGFWNFLLEMGPDCIELSKNLTKHLDKFLAENREKFDVIFGDSSNIGVFLSAESFDMPAIVSSPGFSLAVETTDKKHKFSVLEVIIFKIATMVCAKYIEESRQNRGLQEVVSQNNLLIFEYFSRFPSLIYTSPLLY